MISPSVRIIAIRQVDVVAVITPAIPDRAATRAATLNAAATREAHGLDGPGLDRLWAALQRHTLTTAGPRS